MASKKISSQGTKIEPVYIRAVKLTLITYLLIFILPLVFDVIIGRIDVELAWIAFSADFLQEIVVEFIASVFTILLFRRLTQRGIHPIFRWIIGIVIWLFIAIGITIFVTAFWENLFG